MFLSDSVAILKHGGKTLQTTTIAAQAAVARQDIAVVVAFRNVCLCFFSTLELFDSDGVSSSCRLARLSHLQLDLQLCEYYYFL